jgi:hypothetical protein
MGLCFEQLPIIPGAYPRIATVREMRLTNFTIHPTDTTLTVDFFCEF